MHQDRPKTALAATELGVIAGGVASLEERLREEAQEQLLANMRGEAARPGKRPLRALSAAEKMEAIQRVHEGESKASVARDIGVPESTLRGWCKSEHKIRGMARNSSTPDSEAHSPASSSGQANHLMTASNLSSEDEACPVSSAKKMKLDDCESMSESANNKLDASKQQPSQQQQQPKMDYVSSIINSLVAGGVRPENSSILLQQLGLLSSAQNAASLTKNLLGMSGSGLAAAAHLGGGASQTVGLVENGLQYTKSAGNNHSSKRASSGGSSSAGGHISAIAPTSQLDAHSKSGSRRSLPPAAAEAPLTPLPASPRKSGDASNGPLNLQQHNRSGSKRSSDNGLSSSARKASDEALWLWLAQQQQQQLLGQQAFNPSASGVDGSWFWQWYKQCTYPVVQAQNSLAAAMSQSQQQQHQSSKKSPSKAKAFLDNVLCNNNNNENVRRSLNSFGGEDDELQAGGGKDEDDNVLTTEEAIEHGEQFFKWLNKCSQPAVTQMQILQFKYLLDNLKTCRKKTTSSKHSRK